MVDMSDDFNPGAAPAPTPGLESKRNLLLAPPSIAAHEEKLRALFTTYDRSTTDLQMLDRLSAGFVNLPADTYDHVLLLTDTDGAQRTEALTQLSRDVYKVLVPSMKLGGRLQAQDGSLAAAGAGEAILAGLVEKDGAFEKPTQMEGTVPLRLGGRKKKGGVPNGVNTKKHNLSESKDDENELIDEDGLLSEDDMKRPLQQRSFPPPLPSALFEHPANKPSREMRTRKSQKAPPSLQRLHLRSSKQTRRRRPGSLRTSHGRPQRPQTQVRRAER